MRNIDNLCSVINRRADAVAFVDGSEKYKDINGRVLFYRLRDSVIVRAEIIGLPKKGSQIFAFHIHNGTECTGNKEDAFANAGMHYDMHDSRHPYHAGDMPPLFGTNGNALSVFMTNRFSISEVIGKAIVIHAYPDDFTTQPAGNSGEKIACGIIKPTLR